MSEVLLDTALPAELQPAYPRREIARWFWAVAGVLLLAYLLLQNPYWVPGGDSDFYVAVARTMSRGGGFIYNGLPVAISPPGWPWVLAKIMRFSPEFLTLKLVTMACMYASLLISYFIALRFVRPATAGIAILLCGLLMPVYSLTYFLHSEGLYCLLSAWALLEALRIRERRGGWAGRVVLCLLCVGIPLVRWAGIFQLLPIAAVLLSGERGSPWATRHWKTALACTLILIGTWTVTRQMLQLTADQLKAFKDAGNPGADNDEDEGASESGTVVVIPVKGDKNSIPEEYAHRFLNAGKWFAWLLWQPSRFASVSKWIDLLVGLAGWAVIGLLGWLAYEAFRKGEWLWVSLGVYCGALCMNWPNPNSRYFVPVAPLILIGLFMALQLGRERFPLTNFDLWKWLRRGLFYTVLLANLAMFGVDVIVMRSTHFYDMFEAGQHKDLINAAHYLMALPPPPPTTGPSTVPASAQFEPQDSEIVVNERYENLGRVRYSSAGSRAMVLLTDRDVRALPHGGLSRLMDDFAPKLGRAMKSSHWILIQKPSMPWRLWHFRLTMPLQLRLMKPTTNPADTRESGGWYLYHFDREQKTFTEQPTPSMDDWPTRVPGL